MDDVTAETKHRLLAPLRRQFPAALPVRSIGYIAVKKSWVRRTFPRRFFSFILDGSGEYRRGGDKWPIPGPCVFTQGPGDFVEYGPNTTWEELYLTYADEHAETLLERGLIPKDRPIWFVHHPVSIREIASKLLAALDDTGAFGVADRVDRLCESLILESLISAATPPTSRTAQAIQAARAWLEANWNQHVDFAKLARQHAMSVPSFRHHWIRLVGTPPLEYLTLLRVREASRLLAETDMGIGEIAIAVGYNDPLYFSRKFHQVAGETASAYRKAHRVQPTHEWRQPGTSSLTPSG